MFKACGFGKSSDFEILRSMSDWARDLGCLSHFSLSSIDTTALAESLSSTSLTLTEMRTMLTRIDVDSKACLSREKIIAIKEDHREKSDFESGHWTFLNSSSGKNVSRFELDYKQATDGKYSMIWKQIPFDNPQATGIAVYDRYLGEGAERIVYKMTEINYRNEAVGTPLVAKESIYKQKRQDSAYLKRWHKSFAKTQRKAAKLARKFNERLFFLGISQNIPRIQFLACSTYEFQSIENPDDTVVYLAEKRLDPTNYIKWNNNAGRLDGIHRENRRIYEDIAIAIAVAVESYSESPRACVHAPLQAIAEGNGIEEEEEEEEEEEGDIEKESKAPPEKGQLACSTTDCDPISELEARILEDDIPQAFSHFTYAFTKRQELVCDLQGELNLKQFPPIFELTDPCIHSAENRGKYGRTDHGTKGFHDFFRTHRCNSVCSLLRISNGSENE